MSFENVHGVIRQIHPSGELDQTMQCNNNIPLIFPQTVMLGYVMPVVYSTETN